MLCIRVDLTDVNDRRAKFKQLTERDDIFGVVNNAGIATPNLIEDFDNKIYEKVMDLNATAAAELTAAVVPVLIKNKQGRVVNISSELILGFATRTAYSASKAAISSFARTWALELGKYNICCNAIAPGPVETELFLQNNPPGSEVRKKSWKKFRLIVLVSQVTWLAWSRFLCLTRLLYYGTNALCLRWFEPRLSASLMSFHSDNKNAENN